MATLNSSIEAILENVNADITDPNTTKDGLLTQLRDRFVEVRQALSDFGGSAPEVAPLPALPPQ
jgi:hypothetical protein